jgi:hypothetical protein
LRRIEETLANYNRTNLTSEKRNDISKIMRLFVLTLICCALTPRGAESSSASTDWRQLYYSTNRTRWSAKSDSQLRAEAKSGNAVAMYALAKRIYKKRDRNKNALRRCF